MEKQEFFNELIDYVGTLKPNGFELIAKVSSYCEDSLIVGAMQQGRSLPQHRGFRVTRGSTGKLLVSLGRRTPLGPSAIKRAKGVIQGLIKDCEGYIERQAQTAESFRSGKDLEWKLYGLRSHLASSGEIDLDELEVSRIDHAIAAIDAIKQQLLERKCRKSEEVRA